MWVDIYIIIERGAVDIKSPGRGRRDKEKQEGGSKGEWLIIIYARSLITFHAFNYERENVFLIIIMMISTVDMYVNHIPYITPSRNLYITRPHTHRRYILCNMYTYTHTHTHTQNASELILYRVLVNYFYGYII